ncbi:MAG TPA: AAA family ATPase [Thermoanaerobaculia bacterium]|nr:AAA family ATPase [Thermoanaerobaculia bacterium]
MVIFPVILSPCEWERHSWLRSTAYLPNHGETIEENYQDPGIRKRLFLTLRSHLREQITRLLAAREGPPKPAPAAASPIAGERRQITALGCELTNLAGSGAMDPEEVAEILPEYRSRAAEIVRRLDGHIAQRLGRRLLAYFGFPRVHEDDAQRAVIAARELMEMVKGLNRSAAGAKQTALALKLAIHTGPMVIPAARPDSSGPMLVGDISDEVAALLNLAEPNRIHLSSATRPLVGEKFLCAEAGTAEIKGLGKSLRFYSLEDDGTARGTSTRTELPGRRALVARDQELEILRQRWELAREGAGQVVLIRSEAGIGKSRLVHELRTEVSDAEMVWLECRCSPYHQNTEFYPIIDLLRRVLAPVQPDRQLEDGERLEIVVRRLGMPVETVVPLLSALLSIPLAAGYKPVTLSPEGRKRNTVAAVLDLVLRRAEQQPVVMLVEDLHWIDASSLGFFDLLLEMQGTARVLSLMTFRPDFEPAWRRLSNLSEISLRRLSSKEVGTLISLLAEDKLLPPEVVMEIVEKADGIPLFAEELTKMVTESTRVLGANGEQQLVAAGEKLAVPATLEGSLMARLDRLGTAKGIAQVASVIGREFSHALLSQSVSVDEAALNEDLERLLQSEIILRRGLVSDARYVFKHALIQQAAYQSILSRDARQLHRRIAEALESSFPYLADTQPEIVAFHFTRAGITEKAIDYWQRAAERSIKNSANPEAVAHLTNCLELLAGLPESEERRRREMRLRIALALPLIATRGYGAQEVCEVLSRARDLCTEVGDDTELFHVLRLFWTFQTVRGDHVKACEEARQILLIAESHDAPHLKLEADRVLGSTLFYLGRMEEARLHFAKAIGLYDRQRHHLHVLSYGLDPGIGCMCNESLTLWFMGYPETALARGTEADALARDLGHPYSLCYSLFFYSWIFLWVRDLDRLGQSVEEMILVARRQSFAFWETMGIILRGWLTVQQGKVNEGLATMKGGIANLRRAHGDLYLTSFLSLMADIHARQGEVEAGLAAVEEGLAVVQGTGEGFCEPELYRLKGELLLMQTVSSAAARSEAEECLIRARETAAMRTSKSLELRAAISLSRFWLAEGKREAARQVLHETRQWFSEGSETHDLKRADELLAKLGEPKEVCTVNVAKSEDDDRADSAL